MPSMTLLEACSRGSLVVNSDRHLKDPPQPTAHKTARLSQQNPETRTQSDTERLELQWRDYFRNASQWLDNPVTKSHPNTENFKHNTTDRENRSFRTQKEPIREGVEAEDQAFGAQKEEKMKMMERENVSNARKDGKVVSVSDGNHEESWYDTATLIALLKDCAKRKDLKRGRELHDGIVTRGLFRHDILVSNNLVSMYVKCGALAKAQAVFDELPVRDVVSWNVLISGYAKHRDQAQALTCFQRMKSEGFSPNAVTMVSILIACDSLGTLNKGYEIHAEIVTDGLLEQDICVGTALLNMYTKWGLLLEAQEVFDGLLNRDVATWTSLIGGYAHHGHGESALKCFEQMQSEGLSPNALTLVCILKACGSIGALDKGKEIHSQIVQDESLRNNVHVGAALVDMYAKCNLLEKSQEVFNELPTWDVATCTALISGYAQHGQGEKAIKAFEQMQLRGVSPNAVTFISILKACGSIGALDKGQDIHSQILKEELVEKDIVVANALVDMYAKCGMFGKAQEVFDGLKVRTVVLWNSLISGYTQHECIEEALDCFQKMQLEGISPDALSFSCILKACSRLGAATKGLAVHAEIERDGLLQEDIVLGTGLVDMYASCGMLAEAEEAFNELLVRDVVSWTALIGGYAEHGHGQKALKCFKQMQLDGFQPNAVTFVSILKACGGMEALEVGQEIHTQIAADGTFDSEVHVSSALVDMYVKCGSLPEAQGVFDELPVHDKVSWTALILGYAQQGLGEEALDCFQTMQSEGLFPDAVTFTSVLKACGCIGAANKGQILYAEISRDGFDEVDIGIGTALVDMYANSGMLAEAQQVFDSLSVHDEIARNVLMAGYSQCGEDKLVFNLFEEMVGKGKDADVVTLFIMMNTCSHRGLLDEGQVYFETFSRRFGTVPTLKHFMCMIDLFCRAGHLNTVVATIQEMPYHANLTLWHSLLSACREWGDLELGEWAFEHATRLDNKDTGAYVSMSNISVAAGRKEADRFQMIVNELAWKKQGDSWWIDES